MIARMEHEGFKDIAPKGPNIIQQATNLVKDIPQMIKTGLKNVPEDIYERRLIICKTCYFWDEKGNIGFGKCNHPKCGCSKAKLRLAYSSCPVNSWGAYAV